MNCVGCTLDFEGESIALHDGTVLCARCTFVVTLYHERGIDKKFSRGGLMVHKLSNSIRKAVLEFDRDPKAAYEKYMPALLNRYKGVEVDAQAMQDIVSDEFPFIKLPLDNPLSSTLKDGDEIAISANGSTIFRKVVAHKKFTTKEAKASGYGKRAFVACFVPAEA